MAEPVMYFFRFFKEQFFSQNFRERIKIEIHLFRHQIWIAKHDVIGHDEMFLHDKIVTFFLKKMTHMKTRGIIHVIGFTTHLKDESVCPLRKR